MAENEKRWYADPTKLIPVLVGVTVIGTFTVTQTKNVLPDPPKDRVEYVVDVSGAMKGRVGKKAKLPAVATEIVDRTKAQPDVAAALRLAGGDCRSASHAPEVGFHRDNGKAIRAALQSVRPHGKSNFANAVTLAASDLQGGDGLTTILVIVGGRDTCTGPRAESIIRDALDDLRNQPNVKVNFKFVGVKVPRSVRKMLERAKRQARSLKFLAVTDYVNREAELPDITGTPTPTPTATGTPSPADTSEATP